MSKTTNTPASDEFSPSFAALLEIHRNALGLKMSELFAMTKEASGVEVNQSYFARWQAGERGVSRELVARFAITIVKEYVIRREKGIPFNVPTDEKLSAAGWEHIGWTLHRFFASAGLVPRKLQIAEPPNVAWDEIRGQRLLKIGWVECPPWSENPGKGRCIEVADLVARLLGLEPDFRPFERWSDLEAAIQSRKIHVTAPIMIGTPDRLLDYQFSHEIGGKKRPKFGIRILIDKTQWKKIPEKFVPAADSSQFMLGYVQGEIGHLASRLLSKNSLSFKDLAAAVTWMREGSQTDRRVVAAEAETVINEAKRNSTLSAIPADELKMEFGLCFAAHVDESALIHAINSTITQFGAKIDSILRPKAKK